ncbi:hypothetical protein QQF64_016361 [Cirrhinus molitorella]|uniref:Uncharacterized protein n=1 Tax=Cirrhinus molitorella TaxID=172907 RepID=A0ABR3LMK8_9TELE
MQIEDPLTLKNMKSEGMASNHKTQPCVSSSTVCREQRSTKKAKDKVLNSEYSCISCIHCLGFRRSKRQRFEMKAHKYTRLVHVESPGVHVAPWRS